jgi:hypothetical protein
MLIARTACSTSTISARHEWLCDLQVTQNRPELGRQVNNLNLVGLRTRDCCTNSPFREGFHFGARPMELSDRPGTVENQNNA